MKKVIFTALAFIAFSGVSMANTVADEEIVKENKVQKNEQSNQIVVADCNQVAAACMELFEDSFGCIESSKMYNSLYNMMYNNCMNSQH